MKKLCFVLFLVGLMNSVQATTYYLATDGSDYNSGTSLDAPLGTFTRAVIKARAGDIVYVRGGVYSYSDKISLTREGTSDSPITFSAYENETPIIDFSSQEFGTRGFSLSGTYWIFKGFTIRESGDNGMFISGSNNTIENCVFYKNRDTGLQLGNGASSNRIINCDSYGNADPTDYADADGFACKMDVGNYNYFYGCRAWLNVDDGWDGYLRGADDVYTTLENCWTWMNGYFLDGSDGGKDANGNGFKVGGSDDKTLMHNFTLINCVAFDNKAKGFDQNNSRGTLIFHNCTGFRNLGNNFSIPLSLNSGKTAEVKNCISIEGEINLGSFVSQEYNSWDGFSFDDGDFQSLDTTGVSGPRQADGSLPELDVFRLAKGSVFIDAGTDLGYAYNGTAPDLGAFESDYSTGIYAPLADDFDLILLGNPVSTSLKMQLNIREKETVSLKVLALNGQVIQHQSLETTVGIQTIDMDVSGCSTGLYLLVVQSNQGYSATKFVKH